MLSGGMGMLGRRGRKERKRLMALLHRAMVLSGMECYLYRQRKRNLW